jgi:flavin-dependent dehydrogenase
MTSTPHIVEAHIVGGGPAGSAVGTLLARSGRQVQIIEQSSGMHHKVCGEFLSHEAVTYLRHLGLDPEALGAVPIHGVRLARRSWIAECALPFTALSITRRTLDEALLALAQRAGATVKRGQRVDNLQRSESPNPHWLATLSGGAELHARSVFLATGKHDVAGHRRPGGTQNDLVAFKMYFRLAAPQQESLRGWVELVLFPGGYAGLQLAEEGETNLCLLVNRATLRRCGSNWRRLLEYILNSSEHLAERLSGALPLHEKPFALSSIPFGMLSSAPDCGLWRIGDQAAVTPSFSGDGMSIALHSAFAAAELFIRGGTSGQLAGQLRRDLRRPIAAATIYSRLMIAAPELAAALRPWPWLLRAIAWQTRVPQSAFIS